MHSFCKATLALGLKDICKENVEANTQFLEHVAEFGLSYGTQEEYLFRQEIFTARDAEYKAINADKNNTFTVGHNHMSTWTKQEYKKLLGYKAPKEMIGEEKVLDVVGIPASLDWREQGAVNPVKNQGQCGSCWAFSATASIEGHHYLRMSHLYSLSEQELVSCAHDGCNGCQGGWQAKGMEYTMTAGQVLESEYPYTSGRGQSGSCQRRGTPQVYVESVAKVPANSSDQLKAAIYQGPCSVTVAAESSSFMGYTSGIVNTPSCGTQLDHAITGVGYGVENGQEYYIVRNSWGPTWGEQGYIRIAAQKTGPGICGIQQVSVWPTLREPHPRSQ